MKVEKAMELLDGQDSRATVRLAVLGADGRVQTARFVAAHAMPQEEDGGLVWLVAVADREPQYSSASMIVSTRSVTEGSDGSGEP